MNPLYLGKFFVKHKNIFLNAHISNFCYSQRALWIFRTRNGWCKIRRIRNEIRGENCEVLSGHGATKNCVPCMLALFPYIIVAESLKTHAWKMSVIFYASVNDKYKSTVSIPGSVQIDLELSWALCRSLNISLKPIHEETFDTGGCLGCCVSETSLRCYFSRGRCVEDSNWQLQTCVVFMRCDVFMKNIAIIRRLFSNPWLWSVWKFMVWI